VSLYRQFGLAALARRKRTDTGEHREISARLKEAIEGIALQKPPIPVAAICRQARRLAQDLGEDPPSYWLVYRIVAALPADLVTLAHDGTKAYSNAFELVHRREADAPNAIWQADHTPLDILLFRPDGEVAKPWLTTVIDDYSRAVAGYFLSFEDPCALHTSLALRQAIWRKEDPRWIVCGIPDVLYTDNGSDFTSQHFGTGRSGLENPTGILDSRKAEGPRAYRKILLHGERDVFVRTRRLCAGRRSSTWQANADAGRVRHQVSRLPPGRVPQPRKFGNKDAAGGTLGGHWFPASDA